MYCPNCGSNVGDSKFCPNCGNPMSDVKRNAEPEVLYSKPCQEPGGAQNGWKRVNKIAYGLIAILVGGLGIHRFYAGKIFSGIMYILFCWTGIPSILALVEGIIALTREDDGHGNIYVDPDKYFV